MSEEEYDVFVRQEHADGLRYVMLAAQRLRREIWTEEEDPIEAEIREHARIVEKLLWEVENAKWNGATA